MQRSIIGIDISKDKLQVCVVSGGRTENLRLSVDAARAYIARLPPSLVGLESCATANDWGRTFQALGHEVRLIPPQYVKAFVKRDKTDTFDALAITEALQRPDMRWSTPKSVPQQEALTVHRVRALLIKTRVAHSNALRGCCAEFGISAPVGRTGAPLLSSRLVDLPEAARTSCELILRQIELTSCQLRVLDHTIVQTHRESQVSLRLASIPGIGPITASALVSTVADAAYFRDARSFSSWLGLTPHVRASGSRLSRGGISKRGDGYLRRLLVLGAMSAIRWRSKRSDPWLERLLLRKPVRVAAVALANRNARVAWALMTHGGVFDGSIASTPRPSGEAGSV